MMTLAPGKSSGEKAGAHDDSDQVFHLRPYLQLQAVYSSLDLYRCGLMLCNNGMLVLMEHSV